MTRVKYVLKELVRNIYRNPATSFGSFLSLALLFLLFDIFWIAARTSDRFYDEVVSELKVELFIPESVEDSAIAGLGDKLFSLEGVRQVDFVSREQARRELASLVGVDLLVDYDSLNPLPRSFTLRVDNDKLTSLLMEELADSLSRITGSQSIYYSRNWLAKAEQTRKVFSTAGFALGLLILLAALVSSANNIRMLARVRNAELRQLLLVGAGKLFATMPFLLEGLLLSGLAAAAGWFAIIYAHQNVEFSQLTILLPLQDEIILFIAACSLLGAISGYLGARRMLS